MQILSVLGEVLIGQPMPQLWLRFEPKRADDSRRERSALQNLVLRLDVVGLLRELRRRLLTDLREPRLLTVDLNRDRRQVSRHADLIPDQRSADANRGKRQHGPPAGVYDSPVLPERESPHDLALV